MGGVSGPLKVLIHSFETWRQLPIAVMPPNPRGHGTASCIPGTCIELPAACESVDWVSSRGFGSSFLSAEAGHTFVFLSPLWPPGP